MVGHDPLLQALKQRQDEVLLERILDDELKQMAGEVKRITILIVYFVLKYCL